jgi:hypothetical protein
MVPMGGLEPPLPKETDFESLKHGFNRDNTTFKSLLQLVLVFSGFLRFRMVYA